MKNNALLNPEKLPKPLDEKNVQGLEEWILIVLLSKELYGLQIIEAIELATEGKVTPSVGNLYPTLQRLENRGYIISRMEDTPSEHRGGARRKYFRITQRGSRKLAEAAQIRDRLADWQPKTA